MRFSATNADEVQAQVSLAIDPAGVLEYIPGSSRLTWNPDGQGQAEYQSTTIADGVATGGIELPSDMHGCNNFIAQVGFMLRVRSR